MKINVSFSYMFLNKPYREKYIVIFAPFFKQKLFYGTLPTTYISSAAYFASHFCGYLPMGRAKYSQTTQKPSLG